jgi:hypothetical protein
MEIITKFKHLHRIVLLSCKTPCKVRTRIFAGFTREEVLGFTVFPCGCAGE